MPKEERSTWGSKRQRGKNSWQLRWPNDGHETFHGTSKEADRRLAELRILYEGAPPDITLHQFWSAYYAPEAKDHLAESTWTEYERRYERDLREVWGDIPLRKITARPIQQWLSTMTYGSAKKNKALLSAILSRAFALEMVDDNPAQRRGFILPKKDKSTPSRRTKRVYTLEELNEIFKACKGEHWEAYFIMAAFGGGQRAEVAGVKPEEVELVDDYAVVPICRGVHRLNGEVVVSDHVKNEYRAANLIVRPPYSSRLDRLALEAMRRGDTWLTDDGFGNPDCPERVVKQYERWFQQQPFRYIPFGNLRNAFSTSLHAMGLEDSTVSKLMRHSTLQTDYANYNRLSANELIDLMDNYGQHGRKSSIYGQ